jgi:integral membrane protein
VTQLAPGWFRGVAILEGFSWLGLLTGMYFKYLTEAGDVGVAIFGPLHGGLFLAYVVLVFAVAWVQGWSRWVLAAGLAAAVPPLATWIFEWWVHRTGRLGRATEVVAAAQIVRT